MLSFPKYLNDLGGCYADEWDQPAAERAHVSVIPVVLAAGEEGDADGSWLKAKTWDNHGQ
jgi:hypothetical protein